VHAARSRKGLAACGSLQQMLAVSIANC